MKNESVNTQDFRWEGKKGMGKTKKEKPTWKHKESEWVKLDRVGRRSPSDGGELCAYFLIMADWTPADIARGMPIRHEFPVHSSQISKRNDLLKFHNIEPDVTTKADRAMRRFLVKEEKIKEARRAVRSYAREEVTLEQT